MPSDQGQNEPRFEAPNLSAPPSQVYERPAPPPRPRRARWLAAAIAVAALTGFSAVAWYATSKGQNDSGAVVPVIAAQNDPVKERPAEPGGLDIPNRNLQVFNRITPDAQPQKVERLLPPAEAPVARPAKEAAPPAGPLVPDAPAVQPRSAMPATEIAKAAEPVAPVMSEAKEPAKKAAVASAPPAPAPKAAPQVAAAAAGGWRIQLGSVHDRARADASAQRLQKAHSDLIGKLSSQIARADLGPKGVYYRIQMGPLADRAAANDMCRKLAARKVGCIVVKP